MGLGLDTAMAGTVILSPLLMGIFLCLVLTYVPFSYGVIPIFGEVAAFVVNVAVALAVFEPSCFFPLPPMFKLEHQQTLTYPELIHYAVWP